jgi:hypothetical protein
MDAGKHGLLTGEASDPVERGIRKNSVELVVVG